MEKFSRKVEFVNVEYEPGEENQTKDVYVVTLKVRVKHLKSKKYFDTKKDTLGYLFKGIPQRLPYLAELVERHGYRGDKQFMHEIIKFFKP